jgi:hypothetical protein
LSIDVPDENPRGEAMSAALQTRCEPFHPSANFASLCDASRGSGLEG